MISSMLVLALVVQPEEGDNPLGAVDGGGAAEKELVGGVGREAIDVEPECLRSKFSTQHKSPWKRTSKIMRKHINLVFASK